MLRKRRCHGWQREVDLGGNLGKRVAADHQIIVRFEAGEFECASKDELGARGIEALGHRAQIPSTRSSPIVSPLSALDMRFAARTTPGMNDDRSYESWRIDNVWPVVPSNTS